MQKRLFYNIKNDLIDKFGNKSVYYSIRNYKVKIKMLDVHFEYYHLVKHGDRKCRCYILLRVKISLKINFTAILPECDRKSVRLYENLPDEHKNHVDNLLIKFKILKFI